MTKTKFFLFSIIRLPSTIIHELLHALPVLFFTILDVTFNILRAIISINSKQITRITRFNLIPDYRNGTLGSVGYFNASQSQSIVLNLLLTGKVSITGMKNIDVGIFN